MRRFESEIFGFKDFENMAKTGLSESHKRMEKMDRDNQMVNTRCNQITDMSKKLDKKLDTHSSEIDKNKSHLIITKN